ncbi:MAG: hypothetical protein JNL09_00610 [Anaerolineales bacterium]|nr:hypothetical protein [Anaerolineales bacterium]
MTSLSFSLSFSFSFSLSAESDNRSFSRCSLSRLNLANLPTDAHPLLRTALETAVANLQPTPASEIVFTDDLAPVEFISNSIVIDFFLRGGVSQFE